MRGQPRIRRCSITQNEVGEYLYLIERNDVTQTLAICLLGAFEDLEL